MHPAALQALKHSEEKENRYRQLIQSLPAAIYTCDAAGRIQFFNKAAALLWGREPLIGEDLWCGSWKIYKTDGSPLPLDSCPMAIALHEGRAVFGQEIVIERPDGVRRNILPHPRPIFNLKGEVIEAVNMLVDITDHKRSQEALSESEGRFKTVADQAPVLIWMTDENGNCIYVNNSWCNFTGADPDHANGNGWLAFVHPEDRSSFESTWKDALQRRHSYELQFRFANAAGEYRHMRSNGKPRLSETGIFMGFIVLFTDITAEANSKNELEELVEQRTRDLIKANSGLERSNRELEQFAYVASHDLQEPLRKIQAFSNLLQKNNEGRLNEQSDSYIYKIVNAADRLSKLIDDLLNFSRLSRFEGVYEQADLNEILKKVLSDYELQISKSNVHIEREHLPVLEANVVQMNQLFQNLLSNCLKFITTDHQPQLKISCRKMTQQEVVAHPELNKAVKHFEITFSDNGIGFEQEYAEQIFMIFKRLHGQFEYPGSGIGLSLCRKIVLNHGGKITASGLHGQGATFTIMLPEVQPGSKK